MIDSSSELCIVDFFVGIGNVMCSLCMSQNVLSRDIFVTIFAEMRILFGRKKGRADCSMLNVECVGGA
jgi:hypothetical protein